MVLSGSMNRGAQPCQIQLHEFLCVPFLRKKASAGRKGTKASMTTRSPKYWPAPPVCRKASFWAPCKVERRLAKGLDSRTRNRSPGQLRNHTTA